MNNITTKAKNLAYTAAGTTAMFLSTGASAASDCTTGGDSQMTECVTGLMDGILTHTNISAIGNILTFTGLVIVIWKITEIIFKGEPAKDKIGMLLGGIIIAIMGTKFIATLELIGYDVPDATTATATTDDTSD